MQALAPPRPGEVYSLAGRAVLRGLFSVRTAPYVLLPLQQKSSRNITFERTKSKIYRVNPLTMAGAPAEPWGSAGGAAFWVVDQQCGPLFHAVRNHFQHMAQGCP